MNPFLLEALAKEKHREMLEEAKRQRLLAVYDANNPTKLARLHLILGDFFIRFGEKLKSRHSQQFSVDSNLWPRKR